MSIIPMLLDSAVMFGSGGSKSVLDYRTSGTPTDSIFGAPGIDFVDQFSSGLSGVIDATIEGRPVSQKEAMALYRSALGNWLPTTTLFSYMIQDRPKFPPRN